MPLIKRHSGLTPLRGPAGFFTQSRLQLADPVIGVIHVAAIGARLFGALAAQVVSVSVGIHLTRRSVEFRHFFSLLDPFLQLNPINDQTRDLFVETNLENFFV